MLTVITGWVTQACPGSSRSLSLRQDAPLRSRRGRWMREMFSRRAANDNRGDGWRKCVPAFGLIEQGPPDNQGANGK